MRASLARAEVARSRSPARAAPRAASRTIAGDGRRAAAPTRSRTLALRASDAERERTATLLREHSAAGRLTPEELDERLDAAYAARTVGELEHARRRPAGRRRRRAGADAHPPARRARGTPAAPAHAIGLAVLVSAAGDRDLARDRRRRLLLAEVGPAGVSAIRLAFAAWGELGPAGPRRRATTRRASAAAARARAELPASARPPEPLASRRSPTPSPEAPMALVETEDRGAVRHLILNRPEKRNAMHGELVLAIGAALKEAADLPGRPLRRRARRGRDVLLRDGLRRARRAGRDAAAPARVPRASARRVERRRGDDEAGRSPRSTAAASAARWSWRSPATCARWRADAIVGMPETRVGLIPDVGGSSRLPARRRPRPCEGADHDRQADRRRGGRADRAREPRRRRRRSWRRRRSSSSTSCSPARRSRSASRSA